MAMEFEGCHGAGYEDIDHEFTFQSQRESLPYLLCQKGDQKPFEVLYSENTRRYSECHD